MRRLLAVILALVAVVAGCGGRSANERAVTLARQAYERAKAQGVDMSRGPCLGVIQPGWVADVAHDPRRPVDDDPANQCAAYRTGKAQHFVELAPDGHLIRSG
jgi:hypothetical protein